MQTGRRNKGKIHLILILTINVELHWMNLMVELDYKLDSSSN